MKTRTPVARGSRDCFRTRNVSAPCDVCGARPEVVHIPCMAGASDAPSTARTAGRRQIFEIMRTSWYWTLQRSSDSAHNTSGGRERGPDRDWTASAVPTADVQHAERKKISPRPHQHTVPQIVDVLAGRREVIGSRASKVLALSVNPLICIGRSWHLQYWWDWPDRKIIETLHVPAKSWTWNSGQASAPPEHWPLTSTELNRAQERSNGERNVPSRS